MAFVSAAASSATPAPLTTVAPSVGTCPNEAFIFLYAAATIALGQCPAQHAYGTLHPAPLQPAPPRPGGGKGRSAPRQRRLEARARQREAAKARKKERLQQAQPDAPERPRANAARPQRAWRASKQDLACRRRALSAAAKSAATLTGTTKGWPVDRLQRFFQVPIPKDSSSPVMFALQRPALERMHGALERLAAGLNALKTLNTHQFHGVAIADRPDIQRTALGLQAGTTTRFWLPEENCHTLRNYAWPDALNDAVGAFNRDTEGDLFWMCYPSEQPRSDAPPPDGTTEAEAYAGTNTDPSARHHPTGAEVWFGSQARVAERLSRLGQPLLGGQDRFVWKQTGPDRNDGAIVLAPTLERRYPPSQVVGSSQFARDFANTLATMPWIEARGLLYIAAGMPPEQAAVRASRGQQVDLRSRGVSDDGEVRLTPWALMTDATTGPAQTTSKALAPARAREVFAALQQIVIPNSDGHPYVLEDHSFPAAAHQPVQDSPLSQASHTYARQALKQQLRQRGFSHEECNATVASLDRLTRRANNPKTPNEPRAHEEAEKFFQAVLKHRQAQARAAQAADARPSRKTKKSRAKKAKHRRRWRN